MTGDSNGWSSSCPINTLLEPDGRVFFFNSHRTDIELVEATRPSFSANSTMGPRSGSSRSPASRRRSKRRLGAPDLDKSVTGASGPFH